MFEAHQKSTGTGYTRTIALLTVALIFSPGYLFAAHPVGSVTLSLAIASSLICMSLAWISWKRTSRLTIPSLVKQEAQPK